MKCTASKIKGARKVTDGRYVGNKIIIYTSINYLKLVLHNRRHRSSHGNRSSYRHRNQPKMGEGGLVLQRHYPATLSSDIIHDSERS